MSIDQLTTIRCGLLIMNSNPIATMLVANLTEEQKSAVRQVLEGMLHERSGGGGSATLTNLVNIGIGTK